MKTMRLHASQLKKLRFPRTCCCCLAPIDHDGKIQTLSATSQDQEYKLKIPTCVECQWHWDTAQEHASRGARREFGAGGFFAMVIAIAMFGDLRRIDETWGWQRTGLHVGFWVLLLLIVAAIFMWIPQWRSRPKTPPGHAPFHLAPVSFVALTADHALGLKYANPEAQSQFEALNDALIHKPRVKQIYGGIAVAAAFIAWTIYLVADGFTWWSLATGFGALGGLAQWSEAYAPKEPSQE